MTRDWSWTKRFSFRFVACYLLLYGLCNGNGSTLPLSLVATHGEAPRWATAPGRALSRAVASLVGFPGASEPFDNGDRLGDWLLVLGLLFLALAGATVWSAAARGRRDHRRELPWLLVGLRFVLAGSVSAYALWKVVPVQFGVLDPTMYFHTYGQASPMGLLWMFMGVRPAYQMFAGWMELGGAALLLFRRTALAGALLLLVVLGNVVVLDIAFDVDAKLCAIHLWLMALAIVTPSLGRLLSVVVLHRGAPATSLGPPSGRVGWLAKTVFVAAVLGSQLPGALSVYREHRDGRPLPRFAGAYDVDEMRRDGQLVPPLLTDKAYWQHVAFGRPGALVSLLSGGRRGFQLSTDAAGQLRLSGERSSLTVAPGERGDGDLRLEGEMDGVTTSVHLVPTSPSNTLLVTRGPRWVNEGPFLR